jgi:four helix bundle protein
LLRSGTSPAPNYGEARGAESKKDFIHKLGIVKELNESGIWLEVARRSQLLVSTVVSPVQDECTQLSKIMSSSISTARGVKK